MKGNLHFFRRTKQ